jgi:hypothetical protein
MKCSVRIALVVASAGFLGGCGPAVSNSEEGGTDGNSGSGDAGASMTGRQTTTTTGSTTTAGGTGGTTAASTADPSTTGSDSTDPTSSSSADATTDPSSGTRACAEDDAYRGALIIGGVDRIRIFRRDDVADTCTWLTLVALPGGESTYDVDATTPWVLESAAWNEVADSCDSDFPGEAGENPIPDAWGTIELEQASPQLPCFAHVDVQLQLLFNPDPAVIVEMCQSMIVLSDC